ncbi:MAG: OmpA family protein [Verrucomicrobiaceae bacterium]|nr:OmpA family protein [Verrucomicrobiaceae bacterium]
METRGSQRGSGLAATLAVMAAVIISVAIFFLVTRPALKVDPAAEVPENAGKQLDDPSVRTGSDVEPTENVVVIPDPVVPPSPANPPVPVVPEAPAVESGPGQLVEEIAKRVAAGDFAGAEELLGSNAGGSAAALGAIFGDAGYELAADHVPAEVGIIGDVVRWVLPVRKRGSVTQPEAPPERIFIDLVKRVNERGEIEWSVKKIHYPPAIDALVASVPNSITENVRTEEDALMMADGFITAIRRLDYEAALGACDPESVAEEKIAGLCIVFEEGEISLRQRKPLVATALNEQKAWVIAHVESNKLGQPSEFGLVMKRAEKDGKWQITEINFGKLLDTYIAASEAGKVPYTPIKSRPGSGDMLVLYFEYDNAELLPRAKRQIEILAGILKTDVSKTLSIVGHADALGSENYNVRLSAARAAAVKQQISAFGVPENQVITTGLGEAEPWKSNKRNDGSDNPKGRSYNRRAELGLHF